MANKVHYFAVMPFLEAGKFSYLVLMAYEGVYLVQHYIDGKKGAPTNDHGKFKPRREREEFEHMLKELVTNPENRLKYFGVKGDASPITFGKYPTIPIDQAMKNLGNYTQKAW